MVFKKLGEISRLLGALFKGSLLFEFDDLKCASPNTGDQNGAHDKVRQVAPGEILKSASPHV